MNRYGIGLLAALLMLASSALAADKTTADKTTAPTVITAQVPQTPTSDQPLLGNKVNFVQTSQQATLQKLSDGRYRLILTGVDHRVLWFANKQNGNAGLWDLSHFIERWNVASKSLIASAPNATLVANTKIDNGGTDVLKVFAIQDPQYNVRNDTLSYRAKLIYNANHDADSHPLLYQATLFIDIVCQFGGECF